MSLHFILGKRWLRLCKTIVIPPHPLVQTKFGDKAYIHPISICERCPIHYSIVSVKAQRKRQSRPLHLHNHPPPKLPANQRVLLKDSPYPEKQKRRPTSLKASLVSMIRLFEVWRLVDTADTRHIANPADPNSALNAIPKPVLQRARGTASVYLSHYLALMPLSSM